MLKSQTVFYRTGQILSIAANGELFAILASATYIDPGNVMHDFKNLHQNYLAIYSTHGDHIIETQKITQLPFDSYKVIPSTDGFTVICPRQIIFKRFKNIDLRLRFSYLFEETDADADQIRDYFEVFGKPIDFDFNNLL